jgi:hypothetical protein
VCSIMQVVRSSVGPCVLDRRQCDRLHLTALKSHMRTSKLAMVPRATQTL